MVHVYFKENGIYKFRGFLSVESIFGDAVQIITNVVLDFEKENGSLQGELDEKLLRVPKDYLEKRGFTIIEEKLSDDMIKDILNHQIVVEL